MALEIPENTLIGLQLVLEQFGIVVATPMMVKSDPPNMEAIVAVVALMQLTHNMGYNDLTLQHDEIGYHVRSPKLSRHISELRKKCSRGDFLITGRRYGISNVCKRKIESILKHIRPPEQVPFNQTEWLLLVGLWAALHQCVDDSKVVEIIMSDYIEFLPYVDWAEEAVTLIQSERTA